MLAPESLAWIETGRTDVLRYRRPNGWEVVTNFGTEPYPLDDAEVVLTTADGPEGFVAGESTVWTVPFRGSGNPLNPDDATRRRRQTGLDQPNPNR